MYPNLDKVFFLNTRIPHIGYTQANFQSSVLTSSCNHFILINAIYHHNTNMNVLTFMKRRCIHSPGLWARLHVLCSHCTWGLICMEIWKAVYSHTKD